MERVGVPPSIFTYTKPPVSWPVTALNPAELPTRCAEMSIPLAAETAPTAMLPPSVPLPLAKISTDNPDLILPLTEMLAAWVELLALRFTLSAALRLPSASLAPVTVMWVPAVMVPELIWPAGRLTELTLPLLALSVTLPCTLLMGPVRFMEPLAAVCENVRIFTEPLLQPLQEEPDLPLAVIAAMAMCGFLPLAVTFTNSPVTVPVTVMSVEREVAETPSSETLPLVDVSFLRVIWLPVTSM